MPETMRAWQYKSVTGGMEKNLSINDSVPVPQPKDNQILVQVHSMALNPVDYKVTESPAPLRLLGSVFTPGSDYCGKVTKVGKSAGDFKEGDMVFGAKVGDLVNGTLAQYVAVDSHCAAKVPEDVATDDIAGMGIVGMTEIQALRPHVKEGDHVFINGGSGGTGVYGVQIAKALGCHVVTSCSTANVDFCKSLGADEVLDYKTSDIVKSLSEKGPVLKAIVDNIGTPANLYKASSAYIAPGGNFVQIGAAPSLASMMQIGGNMLRPGFLGGGKAKYQVLMAKAQKSDLETLAGWMKEGKIRGVLDSVFEWEDAPKAYEKLKTGRAKGKIVVHVPHEK